MKSKGVTMIYQYKIDNDKGLIECFLELQHDYPVYIREIERIMNVLKQFRSKIFTVVTEENYVDRQYRDSYYSYFSQKYTQYERNCLRLAFFEGRISQEQFSDCNFNLEKIFIGTVVLRPLEVGNIGQTLLNPKKLNVKGYFRTCDFRVMVYGRKLNINAFPYSSQDGETMTCAETVLFNLIYYYGSKYSEYRILMPSEILQDIERESYERVLPSMGVYESNMAKVLSDAHFYPRIYSYQKGFNDILYAYVESGIPLILNLPEHVVSCIGHGEIRSKVNYNSIKADIESWKCGKKTYHTLNTERLYDKFIVMDDNKAPYYKTSLDDIVHEYAEMSHRSGTIDEVKHDDVSIIVPLYRRIFIDAARAESIFKSLFLENEIFLEDIREAYSDKTWGSKKNPYVWRMYLTASRSYRDFKTRKTANEELRLFYMECALPRFIWVLEIGTLKEYLSTPQKARVEIVLDSTASPYSETRGIISVGYKNHFIFVPEDIWNEEDEEDIEEEIEDEKCTKISKKGKMEVVEICKELGNNFVLTKLFEELYSVEYQQFSENYEIFKDSNLERNFDYGACSRSCSKTED